MIWSFVNWTTNPILNHIAINIETEEKYSTLMKITVV